MFDLEKSISDWRRQMLVAGIETPALEELESHLREEIGQQIKSGLDEQIAFESAIQKIGEARQIKTEFGKIPGATIANRILASIWFAGCLWSFNTVCHQFENSYWADWRFLLANSLIASVYVVGALGSFLLFCKARAGVSIIRMTALFVFVACLLQVLIPFEPSTVWRIWCGISAIFCVVSVWQLHLPDNLKPVS